jgi:hypothetical protein
VDAGTAAENTTSYLRDPATGRVTTIVGPVPPGGPLTVLHLDELGRMERMSVGL